MRESTHDTNGLGTGSAYRAPYGDVMAQQEEETEIEGEGKRNDDASNGSPLLKAMLDNFRDPCLQKMLDRLDEVLTESTSYSRNSAMMRHQVMVITEKAEVESEEAGTISTQNITRWR